MTIPEEIKLVYCDLRNFARDRTADALQWAVAQAMEMEHKGVQHYLEVVLDHPQIVKCENCDTDWLAAAHAALSEEVR